MPPVDPDIFDESSFKHQHRSRRFTERRRTSLGVAVRGCDRDNQRWAENGHLFDVSRSGAGLVLSHKVETSQLIHLTAPIPAELRCFDQEAREYKIWALVRNIRPLQLVENGTPQYEIGVAFVGKTAPPGYEKDSCARYEPLPRPNRDGLWPVREKARSRD